MVYGVIAIDRFTARLYILDGNSLQLLEVIDFPYLRCSNPRLFDEFYREVVHVSNRTFSDFGIKDFILAGPGPYKFHIADYLPNTKAVIPACGVIEYCVEEALKNHGYVV